MRKLFILAALVVATPVFAQGFDINAAMQAAQQMAAGSAGTTGTAGTTASANPLAQQAQAAVMQQALQQVAGNPQLLSQMAGSLTPQQQVAFTQQALAVTQRNLTPAEQAKLTAFTASPEGASIASKLPQIMQQLAPVLLQMYAGNSAGLAPASGK
ncbi:MAG: hypothetical protein EON60_07935 [Alphaproteobacteria bacterium]|nr:MAG: hypothetical protein EON60_07935 [Alphaproteobacteria bacterium]